MTTNPDETTLIVQLETPHNSRGGDWYYRTFAPGQAMAATPGVYVLDLNNIHRRKQELLAHADVLIIHEVCDADLLPVIRERQARGLLTVFEMADDVHAIPPENPTHAFFQEAQARALFRRIAWSCDGAQFSVDALARGYGYLNPNRAVFANQIEEALILPRPGPGPRPVGTALTIGWGGSLGHLGDMAEIAEALLAWLSRHQQVRLHVMGADSIFALFAALPAERKRLFPCGTLADYYDFVRGVDIGLAPLRPNGFNLCRSDVKFLEYAAHGAVPVVQALTPYLSTVVQGETGFLFASPAELLAVLDLLVDDAALRERVAAAGGRYVRSHRLLGQHVGARLEFYRSLGQALGRAGRQRTGPPRPALDDLFAEVAGWAGARVAGRHAILEHTEYEHRLYEGLVLSQRPGHEGPARAAFRAAAALEPQNYQPHVGLAGVEQEPASPLAEALLRNPRSLLAHLSRGTDLLHRGDAGAALLAFGAAAELCPSYEVPYLCAASALARLGRAGDAAGCQKRGFDLFQSLHRAG